MTTEIDYRKRILIIARWPVGGINTYLRYVYGNHQFSEYQLDILVPDIEDVADMRREIRGDNIKILAVPGNIKCFYWEIFRLIFQGRYDLVHSHGFTAGLLAALPARFFAKKHIVTAHEVFTEGQFAGFKGSIKRILVARLLAMANVVQAVSEGAKSNILEFLPTLKKSAKCKTIAIMNGIDVRRFQQPGQRNLRAELHLADNTFIVGFMGRFMSPKGFKYLVLATQRLLQESEIRGRLKVVAVGSGGFVREDTQWIKDLGLERDIHLLPQTSEVPSTLRAFDMVAMPSLWEACGLLAMEALVVGVPVVGSDCNGLAEVLADTPAITVKPRDVEGLAEAIRAHMIDNRRAEFEAYAPIAAERFNVSHMIEKLKQLYEELLL